MPPVFGHWARPVARFKPSPPGDPAVTALALPVGRWLRFQREWAETCVRAACVKRIPGHGPDTPAAAPHYLAGWDETLEAHAVAARGRDLIEDAQEFFDLVERHHGDGRPARLPAAA